MPGSIADNGIASMSLTETLAASALFDSSWRIMQYTLIAQLLLLILPIIQDWHTDKIFGRHNAASITVHGDTVLQCVDPAEPMWQMRLHMLKGQQALTFVIAKVTDL